MKKVLWAIALIVGLLPTVALAQSQRNPCFINTTGGCTPVGETGGPNGASPLPVTVTSGGSSQDVNINEINGAAPSATNPLWVSPATGATFPISGTVLIGDGAQSPADVTSPLLDGLAPGLLLGTFSQNYLYNGSTLSLQRDIPGGSLATGFGVAAVHIRPNSSANSAPLTTVSTAAGSSLVVKASAGNLYGMTVTIGATSGYLLLIDAVSAPADGAVTPVYCLPVTSNGTNGFAAVAFEPRRFNTGITAVFSTTGCFTKTASATAAFFGSYQ